MVWKVYLSLWHSVTFLLLWTCMIFYISCLMTFQLWLPNVTSPHFDAFEAAVALNLIDGFCFVEIGFTASALSAFLKVSFSGLLLQGAAWCHLLTGAVIVKPLVIEIQVKFEWVQGDHRNCRGRNLFCLRDFQFLVWRFRSQLHQLPNPTRYCQKLSFLLSIFLPFQFHGRNFAGIGWCDSILSSFLPRNLSISAKLRVAPLDSSHK